GNFKMPGLSPTNFGGPSQEDLNRTEPRELFSELFQFKFSLQEMGYWRKLDEDLRSLKEEVANLAESAVVMAVSGGIAYAIHPTIGAVNTGVGVATLALWAMYGDLFQNIH